MNLVVWSIVIDFCEGKSNMYAEIKRPLEESERLFLDGQLTEMESNAANRRKKAASIFASVFVLSTIAIALGVIGNNGFWFIIGFIGSMVFLVGGVGTATELGKQKREIELTGSQVREAIEAGSASVKQIDASAVIVVEGVDDVVNVYLFQVEDDQIFSLLTLEGTPEANLPNWPCSHFEIIRTTAHDLYLGTRAAGVSLQPLRRVDYADAGEYSSFESEVLLQGRLEYIVDDIESIALLYGQLESGRNAPSIDPPMMGDGFRNALAVIFILAAVAAGVLGFTQSAWAGMAAIVGFLLICALACTRGRLALICRRIVAAAICLGYLAYIISEIGKPLPNFAQHQQSSTDIINAIVGFCVFGFPAGFYLFKGRLPRRGLLG